MLLQRPIGPVEHAGREDRRAPAELGHGPREPVEIPLRADRHQHARRRERRRYVDVEVIGQEHRRPRGGEAGRVGTCLGERIREGTVAP